MGTFSFADHRKKPTIFAEIRISKIFMPHGIHNWVRKDVLSDIFPGPSLLPRFLPPFSSVAALPTAVHVTPGAVAVFWTLDTSCLDLSTFSYENSEELTRDLIARDHFAGSWTKRFIRMQHGKEVCQFDQFYQITGYLGFVIFKIGGGTAVERIPTTAFYTRQPFTSTAWWLNFTEVYCGMRVFFISWPRFLAWHVELKIARVPTPCAGLWMGWQSENEVR